MIMRVLICALAFCDGFSNVREQHIEGHADAHVQGGSQLQVETKSDGTFKQQSAAHTDRYARALVQGGSHGTQQASAAKATDKDDVVATMKVTDRELSHDEVHYRAHQHSPERVPVATYSCEIQFHTRGGAYTKTNTLWVRGAASPKEAFTAVATKE